MNGNGCAGSIDSGVSTGKYLLQEVIFEPGDLVLGELVGGYALDAFLAQQDEEVGQALLLVLLQPSDFEQDLLQLLLGRAAVRTAQQQCPRAPGRRAPRRGP